MNIEPSNIGNVSMEITIEASAAKVWQTLTAHIGEWWPDDFYAGGSAGNRNFLLETEPGGRMYESWNEGGGTLWGTVVTADPGKSLQIVGNQFPNWGGPIQWYGTWTLEENEGMTKLKFDEAAVGNITAGTMREKDQGWQYLWASLKAHSEGKPAPSWPDS